ncbi:hypothetical protein LEN26_017870 [Aphanomyces euteiches]|nr:hypothetical protein LEN26_017870 [Aphanomyces euteiches]KAH9186705.1 hypothetical protein AeNC1_011319 [Aphanomyces euteiches]
MPQLPIDIAVKIAFFIPERSSLELFMMALRPAHSLGPLEHLWQLLQLETSWMVWPHLTLITTDEPFRLHIEHITQYYSVIQVNETVDPMWLRKYVDHLMRIHWSRSRDDGPSDFEWLTQWKNFRLTVVSNSMHQNPNRSVPLLIDNLPHYQYLVNLTWSDCNTALASAIFQYAATSSSLKKLHICTYEGGHTDHCTIATSMAKDLKQWITLQPVQYLVLGYFTWEDFSLRNQVTTAMLNTKTMRRFAICRNHTDNIAFEGGCEYNYFRLSVEFYKPRRIGVERVVVPVEELDLAQITQDLIGLVQPFFEYLLNPKVKEFHLSGRGIFANCVVWDMVVPYLQQSHLEELDLSWNCMRDHEAFRLEEGISSMKLLKRINLDGNRLSYAGMMAIVEAAPATVNHIYICFSMNQLTATCLHHECNTLLELAKKKSIYLFRRYGRNA